MIDTSTADLREKAIGLIRAGTPEREVAENLKVDLDQLRRLIGDAFCPGCES